METDQTNILPELKFLDEQIGYLAGIGYSKSESLNLLYLSIEQQKVNLQAKMMAKASEDDMLQIQRIASIVYQMIVASSEGKDSEVDRDGEAQI